LRRYESGILLIVDKNIWVGALEAVQRLVSIREPFPGSAGVPPAKLLEPMPLSFFIHAGETPALPGKATVGQPLKP
jgi:hypothetical protein